MKYHFTEQSLIAPVHRISIGVIGVGGTGSSVLSILARMNAGLIGLGHPGFHVISYDSDNVSEANIGRQLFSSSDLGFNKADVITTRINRFYGLDWESNSCKYVVDNGIEFNIIITCVDNMQIRKDINDAKVEMTKGSTPFWKNYYWLDFGNEKNYGQAILGTMCDIPQPKSKYTSVSYLPTIIDDIKTIDAIVDEDKPSCSTLESLNRQDLLVNTTLSEMGMNLIWKLFREYKIKQRGLYMNLDKMTVKPISI